MNSVDLSKRTIGIIIVDDQKLVRQTLQVELEQEKDFKIVAIAENGRTALEKIAKFQPDIAIVDLEMPDINGIRTIEIISDRFPHTKALVLSSHDNREYINQAIVAGAKGYLLKGTSITNLADSVRKVHQGYFQLGSGLLDRLSSNSKLEKQASPQLSLSSHKSALSDIVQALKEEINRQEAKVAYHHTITNSEISKVRTELINFFGQKIHTLNAKQSEAHSNLKKMKCGLYLLLASQLILLIIVICS